jgi:Domain of unknown function (DUF222)
VLRVAANASEKVSGGLQPHLLITMTLDSLRTDLAAAGLPLTGSNGPAGGSAIVDPVAAAHPTLFGGDGGDVGYGGVDVTGGFPGNRAQRRGARRMAVTETGVPISVGWARRLACDATIIPLVLGANSEPLDVGRATKAVPAALRRALIARDKGCAFPGCRRPPRWCDAHHLQHWLDGGPTALHNLVLLCDYHHHVIHHDGWSVAIVDGRPLFTPPAWLDPLQRPRPPTDPTAL